MSGPRASRFSFIITIAFFLVQFCGTCCADELGRLFTTPEERSLLEQLRQPLPPETSQAPPMEDTSFAGQQSGNNDITVQGFVYRKHGRSTVWTNSSFVRVNETADRRLRITTGANAAADALIDVPDGAATIRVRPETTSNPNLTE